MRVALASNEFVMRPQTTRFSEVTAAEDLSLSTTWSGS